MEQRSKDLRDKDNFTPDLVEDVVQNLETYNITDDQAGSQLNNLQVFFISERFCYICFFK